MVKRRCFSLTDEERIELEVARDTHEKAYVREKASALLKIASGESAHAVARKGLLKPRDPDSIYAWLDRYEAEGLKGLIVKTGRGRKPAFSP